MIELNGLKIATHISCGETAGKAVIDSVNKLCHALFLFRKGIGWGTANAKGRDHQSRRLTLIFNAGDKIPF